MAGEEVGDRGAAVEVLVEAEGGTTMGRSFVGGIDF